MPHLPFYIEALFVFTVIATAMLFFKAAGNSRFILLLFTGWLLLQTLISLSGFYLETDAHPPRLVFLIGPGLLLIVFLFISQKGKKFLDSLHLKRLTYLHTIRIPVELVLFWLYQQGMVPELMTFEGRNFDIIAGISAPVIAIVSFKSTTPSKTILLVWNVACLLLLFNIMVNAALSAPSVLQQFAFDQPNVAILYFPFIWLPCFVVPVVLLSHMAAIRQLFKK